MRGGFARAGSRRSGWGCRSAVRVLGWRVAVVVELGLGFGFAVGLVLVGLGSRLRSRPICPLSLCVSRCVFYA